MSEGEIDAVIPNKIGAYRMRAVVGDGAFSVVKLVYNEETQTYYACKIVPRSQINTKALQDRFELEIRINQQLHHPGIVKLFDLLSDENNFYVIMEFCQSGELFQYIVDRGPLSEQDARPFVRQILECLEYIHRQNVTHRDLQPENLLLDQLGRVKLSDFGLSRFLGKDGLVETPCGSPCYASPECISGAPYDGKTTDVWSVGVILYAMLTGQLPWTKRNQAQLFAQIKRGEYTIPEYLTEPCRSFISGLMTVDNRKRLTIQQAYAHEWLSGVPQQYPEYEAPTRIVSLRVVDRFFRRDKSYSELQNIEIQRDASVPVLGLGRTSRMVQRKYAGLPKIPREERPPTSQAAQAVQAAQAGPPPIPAPQPVISPQKQKDFKNVYKGLRVPSRNIPTQGGRRRTAASKPGSSLLTRPNIKRPVHR